jgi:phosphate-selective porin OprO/OprP
MRLHHGAGLITAGLLAALSSKTALAQSAPPQSPNTRMQAIESQIDALQNQLQQLKSDLGQTNQQLHESQTQTKQAQDDARKAQDQAKATAASVPLVTFPNGRPTLSTPDKSASLAIGMQLQFDMGGYFQDNHSNDIQPPASRELNDGSNLRRGRIFVVGKYGDWTANFTPDFGGSPDGSVSLYEANINYSGFKPVTATIGYFKPWYSLQDSMSSNDFLFMERPSIVEIARNVAAGDARASFGFKASTDDYFASAYLTGGTWGDQTAGSLNKEQLGGVMRIAARPFHGEDWNVHAGFSGSAVFQPARSNADQPGDTVENIQLRDRPELRVDMNRLIDTGPLEVDNAYTYGVELGGNWHNFLLQGEYIGIAVDRTHSDPNAHFQGGYVEGSWVITGESRKYNTGSAAWARPVPDHPFNPFDGEGGWGAWELAARYSVTDLNSHDINGGNQQVYGMSLSWYPTSLLRFMLQTDYVDVDRQDSAGTEIGQNFWDVALRSQIAF